VRNKFKGKPEKDSKRMGVMGYGRSIWDASKTKNKFKRFSEVLVNYAIVEFWSMLDPKDV
jgi:hypothetical protein